MTAISLYRIAFCTAALLTLVCIGAALMTITGNANGNANVLTVAAILAAAAAALSALALRRWR